ncbi:energy transducer TonB [Rhodanobacter sp. AS-Z3]|uniref:energy transducer TonB n=1 Tax=Rhodanobacter sp. AS-Z3 TaxID=3031330 RepID=UPI0024795DC2|nr:energy transducer TonB [Rhodanobacter sp. AS-Z3]WEN14014.1 energy transducer TonB [Rhodanobacter sp. AS-Z3]
MAFRKSWAAWLVAVFFCATVCATDDTTAPTVIYAPVQYPASAVSAAEQGTVMVAAEVDVNGRAVNASLDQSSGYPDLDAAALRSVSEWSFLPGTNGDTPVAQRIIVPVRFELEQKVAKVEVAPETWAAFGSGLAGLLGSLVWLIGYGWSVILAKRTSTLWLWCMLVLWVVAYPVFVARHWSVAKRSLLVVLIGMVLLCLALYRPAQPLSL